MSVVRVFCRSFYLLFLYFKPANMPETRAAKQRRLEGGAAQVSSWNDGYAGWRPKSGDCVDQVSAASLTPQTFFYRYVLQCRPVVLLGGLPDCKPCWSLEHLAKAAGDCVVRCEVRASSETSFGLASAHERLPFRRVLSRLAAGDESLYLTTEATHFDAHRRLTVVGSPLTRLLNDVPLVPSLCGNLQLAAMNLWLGNSRDGASSGLQCVEPAFVLACD